jgi:WD40 repeat protein
VLTAAYGSPTQAGFAALSSSGSGLIGSLQLELELSGHGMEHVGTGEVLDVALSSDGVLGATVSTDMKAKVWDLDQQQCVQTLRGHTGWIVSVKVRGLLLSRFMYVHIVIGKKDLSVVKPPFKVRGLCISSKPGGGGLQLLSAWYVGVAAVCCFTQWRYRSRP